MSFERGERGGKKKRSSHTKSQQLGRGYVAILSKSDQLKRNVKSVSVKAPKIIAV